MVNRGTIALAIAAALTGNAQALGRVTRTDAVAESEGALTCGSVFTGDTTGADHVVGSTSGEHYYRLTVIATTEYTFSTCEGSAFDTMLRLYSGNHLEASSVELNYVDDSCSYQSHITRTLYPGAYTLIVEGYSTREGVYQLSTTCGVASVLSHSSEGDLTCGSVFTGDTTGATHVVGSSSGEHYYRLAVPASREYTFSTCEGSAYDTRLRLYSGNHLEASSTELADVDDACGLQSRIVMTLQPGDYTLLVEGFSSREGLYTLTTTCGASLAVTGVKADEGDALVQCRFKKGHSTQESPTDHTWPITMADIEALIPTADVVSMRVFGEGQLADAQWDEMLAGIAPCTRPTHADSAADADKRTFWNEFRQVAFMQQLRNEGAMASTFLRLPRMFRRHTLAEAAAEVEKDFPTHFPTELVKTFLGEGVTFNDNVIPRVGSDFVNSQVMLARLIGWAVSVVSPTAFGAKWHEGRARPEEIAWMIATGDENVNAPADVETDISNLDLADQYAFTAYSNGSPKHPSWPAMHSAASSASLYLAVVLNLNETQTAEAIALDCAVASFRTFAGVHYESDNLAGLSIGQEVLRRELPGFLQANYQSNPDVVTARIDEVIANNDWRARTTCFRR